MRFDDLIVRGLLRMVGGVWIIDDGEKSLPADQGSDYRFDTIEQRLVYEGENK